MNTQLSSNSEYQGAGNMNGNCVHLSRVSTFLLLLLYLLVYIIMDFLGIFTKLQKATILAYYVCLSIQPSVYTQQLIPTERIFMKFYI